MSQQLNANTQTNESWGNIAKGALVEAFADAVEEGRREVHSLVGENLAPGEELLGYQRAEKKVPFLFRILPYIPDQFTAAKQFILAITSRQVLIVRIRKSFFLQKTVGSRVVAAIPFADLESVTPITGGGTSSLTIKTKGGQRFRYKGMLRSSASQFAEDVKLATKAIASR